MTGTVAPTVRTLKDGRALEISLATRADIEAIAQAHPLPRTPAISGRHLVAYYAVKTWLYVTTEEAGVMVGRIEGELAGFVFFYGSLSSLRRRARSLSTARWTIGRLLTGRLGGPRLWIGYAQWARQHFQSGAHYRAAAASQGQGPVAEINAEIGTTHTLGRFRRLGVASALLEATESLLRERAAPEVVLWVAEQNAPALELYGKRGYARMALVDRIGERCWLMAKKLDAARTDHIGPLGADCAC